MIEWLKLWANQIIVAVIIAVIFELIIPNGKNKKYIKMVINLYVLFAILNPIISKFTDSNKIDLFKYNCENYLSNANSIETSSSLSSSDMIIDTTKKTIKEDIQKRLLEKGYKVTSISIDINNSDSKYGEIEWIKLSVNKKDDVGEGLASARASTRLAPTVRKFIYCNKSGRRCKYI